MVSERLERVRELMELKGLDALVALSPENIYYVTEFRALEPTKTFCPVIITRDHCVLLAPKSEEGFVPMGCLIEDIRLARARETVSTIMNLGNLKYRMVSV